MGPAIIGCLGSEGVKRGNTYVPWDSHDSLTDTKLQEPQRSITCPQSQILPWVPWHLPSSHYWRLPHTTESATLLVQHFLYLHSPLQCQGGAPQCYLPGSTGCLDTPRLLFVLLHCGWGARDGPRALCMLSTCSISEPHPQPPSSIHFSPGYEFFFSSR